MRRAADSDGACVGAVVSAMCLVSALAAIAYAAASGDRWPLLFAATMGACALVVGIGGLL